MLFVARTAVNEEPLARGRVLAICSHLVSFLKSSHFTFDDEKNSIFCFFRRRRSGKPETNFNSSSSSLNFRGKYSPLHFTSCRRLLTAKVEL